MRLRDLAMAPGPGEIVLDPVAEVEAAEQAKRNAREAREREAAALDAELAGQEQRLLLVRRDLAALGDSPPTGADHQAVAAWQAGRGRLEALVTYVEGRVAHIEGVVRQRGRTR